MNTLRACLAAWLRNDNDGFAALSDYLMEQGEQPPRQSDSRRLRLRETLIVLPIDEVIELTCDMIERRLPELAEHADVEAVRQSLLTARATVVGRGLTQREIERESKGAWSAWNNLRETELAASKIAWAAWAVANMSPWHALEAAAYDSAEEEQWQLEFVIERLSKKR
ncbi:MAG: hypothetical protein QGG36_29195 [Pirellulaceae bacterium]|jgi:hypothetical protein|nr:hypothetical protein [Pirellulaceae bacterium]MDP7019910.1 hypothetical protein [Pirellulaceae bacterium]